MTAVSTESLRVEWTVLGIAAAVGFLAATFYLGTTPSDGLPGNDNDKVLHALWFAMMVPASLPAFWSLGCRRGWSLRRTLIIAAAYVLLAGGLLEIVQSFTGYRNGDWGDFVADVVGVTVVTALLLRVFAWRRKSRA